MDTTLDMLACIQNIKYVGAMASWRGIIAYYVINKCTIMEYKMVAS